MSRQNTHVTTISLCDTCVCRVVRMAIRWNADVFAGCKDCAIGRKSGNVKLGVNTSRHARAFHARGTHVSSTGTKPNEYTIKWCCTGWPIIFTRVSSSDEIQRQWRLLFEDICRCNVRTFRFLGIKDSLESHGSPFFFYLRHDMTLRVIEIILLCILLWSEWGIPICLSATLYKLCDFSCHLGSSPIRANTSQTSRNSSHVSLISFLEIINFKTCLAYDRCVCKRKSRILSKK